MKDKNLNFDTILIVSIVLLIPLRSLLNPSLYGEDEVSTFLVNVELIEAIININVKDFFINLIKSYHPPGRNLFSIPTILIFGENISALRLPYYITWIFTCFFSLRIIKELNGNNDCKILNIILLSGSGIFHIQIMGFGHGIVSFLGIYLIYELIIFHKKKQNFIPHKLFNKLAAISFIGFLFFNTFILLTFNLFLIQLFLILKNEKKEFYLFFLISFFYFLLYLSYYIIFLGAPYLLVNNPQSLIPLIENIFGKLNYCNWDQNAFGQYHQYIVRQSTMDFNYSSFIANLRYLNWHFFPYIGIFIIFFSLYYLSTKIKVVLFFILTYFLFVNFFMVGNTGQHFASIFIWLIPFFSLNFKEKINFSSIKLFIKFFYLTLLTYTFYFHIFFYSEKNYPYNIVSLVDGTLKWPPNIKRPLEQISKDIRKNYTNDNTIYYTVDGSIIHYYLRDFKSHKIDYDLMLIDGKVIDCNSLDNKIKILITSNNIINNCNHDIYKIIKYKGSNLKLLLK